MLVCAVAFVAGISLFGFQSDALALEERIPKGITIGGIDVGGMSKTEAGEAVLSYVESYLSNIIELDINGNIVNAQVKDLGYAWSNKSVVNEACDYCSKGNIISRYKAEKDIEKEGIDLDIMYELDEEEMKAIISEVSKPYVKAHVNPKIVKNGDSFTATEGIAGIQINEEVSYPGLTEYITKEWKGESGSSFTFTMEADLPTATAADCEKVKDLLGTYTTEFETGSGDYNRNMNIANGAKLLNGITLCPGETFSANANLEPWDASNGWYSAGTYVNGQVVDGLGGGVCQVSTTLYNAAIRAEIEIAERSPHSMTVTYVPVSMDAALAGTWKDLKLKNNLEYPIYIESVMGTGTLTFNIYGVETRPAGRTIDFVSEKLGTVPSNEIVKEDPTKPAGYRRVTSYGHTGYNAQLWKIVYQDGVEQSREVINKSVYNASPTYVTIGTGPAEVPTEPVPGEVPTPGETQAPTQAPTQAVLTLVTKALPWKLFWI